MKSNFYEKVYQITKMIPRGKVATYGQIARILGKPKAGRAVGAALHANPRAPIVPCHRVVDSKGFLHGFARGIEAKKNLLENEEIEIYDNKIDLEKYLFSFDCLRNKEGFGDIGVVREIGEMRD